MTLTDLYSRRAGLSASAELLVLFQRESVVHLAEAVSETIALSTGADAHGSHPL